MQVLKVNILNNRYDSKQNHKVIAQKTCFQNKNNFDIVNFGSKASVIEKLRNIPMENNFNDIFEKLKIERVSLGHHYDKITNPENIKIMVVSACNYIGKKMSVIAEIVKDIPKEDLPASKIEKNTQDVFFDFINGKNTFWYKHQDKKSQQTEIIRVINGQLDFYEKRFKDSSQDRYNSVSLHFLNNGKLYRLETNTNPQSEYKCIDLSKNPDFFKKNEVPFVKTNIEIKD